VGTLIRVQRSRFETVKLEQSFVAAGNRAASSLELWICAANGERVKPSASKQYPLHAETLTDELDANNSLTIIADLVGADKEVLDLGCASGYFARVLARRDCRVVGVDINEAAVEKAREPCSDAIVADLDAVPLTSLVGEQRFDVVVFGDVLEHLMNPARLLEEARDVLKHDGYLVASFPNVAHGAVRLSLLQGRFDYQEEGLLDETHLRFFTLKTVEETLLGAGYRIETLQRSTVDVFDGSHVLPPINRGAFDEHVVERVLSDPEASTLQFIVRAFPLSDGARHRALFKRFSAVNTELESVQLLLRERNRELEEARQRVTWFADRVNQLEIETANAVALRIENARLEERLRMYDERIAALEQSYAAQLEAEAAKTRAQADQIAAFMGSGTSNTS
jgi:2-polyprenyl-3-methyl-5-hydroxy-6-metoxy-1,4-benzoquinol methylase